MAKEIAVTVVIPNWNGRKWLEVVLPSLAKQRYKNFQTVVVDNGSSDGSVGYMRQHWPDVSVIGLPENIGFAPAVNKGIEATRTPYVALLNNDIELDPDWLTNLVQAAEQHPDAGSIASKLLDFTDRTKFESAGIDFSWYAMPVKRGDNKPDEGQFDKPAWVFAAIAGAALYRRQALADVGLFDNDFFAYHEESDWSFRAQLRGWKCWYEPSAVAYHVGGATSGRISRFALYLTNRNIVWLIIKNYPAGALLRHFPKLAFSFAKTFWGAVKGRWVGTLLKAWGAALLKTPKMIGRRRRIQAGRTVSNETLDNVIGKEFPLPSKLLRT